MELTPRFIRCGHCGDLVPLTQFCVNCGGFIWTDPKKNDKQQNGGWKW